TSHIWLPSPSKSGVGGEVMARSPRIPVQHVVQRLARGGREVGSERIGDGDERRLCDLIKRDTKHSGGVLLEEEMHRRQRGTQPPRARRQHKAPRGGQDGSPRARLRQSGLVVESSLETGNQQGGRLVH